MHALRILCTYMYKSHAHKPVVVRGDEVWRTPEVSDGVFDTKSEHLTINKLPAAIGKQTGWIRPENFAPLS